jgi:hypothetical protein
MNRKRILVMGFMGSIPIAGVVWQHLHYIIGLQQLGHDVYYVEDSYRYPYDPETRSYGVDFSYAAKFLATLSSGYGFADKWSFCAPFVDRDATAGLSRTAVLRLYREADAILNVCGSQEITEDLAGNERLLYIDSDPGLEQIKVDQAPDHSSAYLEQHRALFTFGENVGTAEFPVPTHRLRWVPTRQPVVTHVWRTDDLPPVGAVFTSIANWNTNNVKDVTWRGERFLWNKAPQFLRFLAAPQHAGETFELAVEMEPAQTRAEFERHGWRLSEPGHISADIDAYRSYIQRSKGEFTVAKDQYVRLNTGWFSDRSACYLAAGRPVITQQTGFTRFYGGSEGLLAFTSLDEVVDAVRSVNADYPRHSRAAADIAREFFEAETVLRSLLDRAGI